MNERPSLFLTVFLAAVMLFLAVLVVDATAWHPPLVLAAFVLLGFFLYRQLPRAPARPWFSVFCRRLGEVIHTALHGR